MVCFLLCASPAFSLSTALRLDVIALLRSFGVASIAHDLQAEFYKCLAVSLKISQSAHRLSPACQVPRGVLSTHRVALCSALYGYTFLQGALTVFALLLAP